MPIEEKLQSATKEIERKIKLALIEQNMTQADLADITRESRSEINKAVKGNNSRHSTELREKIYKILGVEWPTWLNKKSHQMMT